MGAGIAQLGCLADVPTLLFDASSEALGRADERITKGLDHGVERGRWAGSRAAGAKQRLTLAGALAELQSCELVIEAVVEDLDIKAEVLGQLGSRPFIATNTSSLSVTEIAARAHRPERVVGMHFFNPPPLMRLVEVIPGIQTSGETLAAAFSMASAMGRQAIEAADTVGFVVNRSLRPFYLEALRIADERIASPDVIDRICRQGAGFRMGPFELMDLVGLDTGLAVAESFERRSYGEPRWRPSPSVPRLVAAGRLGRKSGQGWYDYRDGPHRPADSGPPTADTAGLAVAVLGDGPIASALRDRAISAGFAVSESANAPGLALVLVADEGTVVQTAAPVAYSCAAASLASRGVADAVGFSMLDPVPEANLIELTRLPDSRPDACIAIEAFAAGLGVYAEWVADGPGLVLGRIIAQVINEGCFAVGEGVASAADVDLATTLGLNHPYGPLAWGERIGWRRVLTCLDGVWGERLDDRYRAAPLLRHASALNNLNLK